MPVRRLALSACKAPACVGLFVVALLVPHRAQSQSPLESLNQHFVGRWVGVNHDFTKSPEQDLALSITVATDKHGRKLDMDYVYSRPTTSQVEEYKRRVVFEPDTSTVVIDRKKLGKQRQRAGGLDALLRDGYGELVLHGVVRYNGDKQAIERTLWHISPEAWSYEIYVSSSGAPFVETAAISLKRETSAP